MRMSGMPPVGTSGLVYGPGGEKLRRTRGNVLAGNTDEVASGEGRTYHLVGEGGVTLLDRDDGGSTIGGIFFG